MNAPRVTVFLLVGGVSWACFEPAGPPIQTMDTQPIKDSAGPDTTQAKDTLLSVDSSVVVDTQPGLPDSVGEACTTDGHCLAMQGGDLCAGLMRCINYTCQLDPSSQVTCPPSEDPCYETDCVPATGQCVLTKKAVCQCKPAGTVYCGVSKELSTADAGASTLLSNYSCGPQDAGVFGEHVFLFLPNETGPVKIVDELDSLGAIWVLGYDGQECVPDSCIAGSKGNVGFFAQAGAAYVVVAEHPGDNSVFARFRSYCGVTQELDCADGLDDDLNGAVDCADASCLGVGACPADLETECDDGKDDDSDGKIDCLDPDCAADPWCNQPCVVYKTVSCDASDSVSSVDFQSETSNYYTCGPEAGGYEVVYRFMDPSFATVLVELDTPVQSMGLYHLLDNGTGCQAKNCVVYDKKQIVFQSTPNSPSYISVDSAKNAGGTYFIKFNCL
jgi:hypothetical protein